MGFGAKTLNGREYTIEAFNDISQHFLILMPFSVLVFYLVAP